MLSCYEIFLFFSFALAPDDLLEWIFRLNFHRFSSFVFTHASTCFLVLRFYFLFLRFHFLFCVFISCVAFLFLVLRFYFLFCVFVCRFAFSFLALRFYFLCCVFIWLSLSRHFLADWRFPTRKKTTFFFESCHLVLTLAWVESSVFEVFETLCFSGSIAKYRVFSLNL